MRGAVAAVVRVPGAFGREAPHGHTGRMARLKLSVVLASGARVGPKV